MCKLNSVATKLNSVATLIIPDSAAAQDPAVAQAGPAMFRWAPK